VKLFLIEFGFRVQFSGDWGNFTGKQFMGEASSNKA